MPNGRQGGEHCGMRLERGATDLDDAHVALPGLTMAHHRDVEFGVCPRRYDSCEARPPNIAEQGGVPVAARPNTLRELNPVSTMRTYPTDSPEAAARIIALTLLADGHVGAVELATLERVGACDQLGLDLQAMHDVLQVFCEDLQLAREGQWADACRIDPRALASLMAEVESPVLRTTVLRLCVAVVEADDHVTDGESIVVVAAVEQWGLHREMLRVASVDLNAT